MEYYSTPKHTTPKAHSATASRQRAAKTPLKTPSLSQTPSQDRYIPSRSGMNMDISSFNLTKEQGDTPTKRRRMADTTVAQEEYQNTLSERLFDGKTEGKILKFKGQAPTSQSTSNPHKVLYQHLNDRKSSSRTSSRAAVKRNIPTLPERIVDAPDIVDDYYLNLVDWSKTNLFTVALHQSVFMLNATTGDVNELMHMDDERDFICSVNWMDDGRHIAIGDTRCQVQIWDAERMKQVRRLTGHTGRVSSLAWNGSMLSSGSRDNTIKHWDVRLRNPLITQSSVHTQEVCGLKWSPCGEHLASGANDNLLCVWKKDQLEEPLHKFTKHCAAVKAIDWCPHEASLLASGGGTADRHIRFWNVSSGRCIGEQDTRSQVCALKWSTNHRGELVSSHGFSMNQLTVWKYPRMTRIAELTGHTSRVLHLAQSPDGETIASAAGDETVRFWRAFEKTPYSKKAASGNNSSGNARNLNATSRTIR